MGLAGALLVFTGIWHITEWMMGGRNRDTLRLIPFGIIYFVFGYLIVTLNAGTLVLIAALVVTFIGMSAAFVMRKELEVRPWVLWAFILIDAVIIISLLMGLIS